MSFDIVLARFVAGEPVAAPKERALDVMARYANRVGDLNECDVFMSDGSSVEVRTSGLANEQAFQDALFVLRRNSFSALVIEMIFDLAKAADMVIISSGGQDDSETNLRVILTDEAQRSNLLPSLNRNPVLCHSPIQLQELLRDGYRAWTGWAFL